MWSSEILHILAANNCHIVWEKSYPQGGLKRDFITIKTDDCRDLEYRTPEGLHVCPIEVPRETLDDFIRASFVQQDGDDDDRGRAVFRLTTDGKIRGHDRASALRTLAAYVEEHPDATAGGGPERLSPDQKHGKRVRVLDVAVDLESLARVPLSEPLPYSRFEALLDKLHAEGFFPFEWQVKAVTQAFHRDETAGPSRLLQILSRYGVSMRTTPSIEPHRDDHGLWRLKFSSPGDPAVLMDIGGATKLSIDLRQNAEGAFADRLDAAVATAKRYVFAGVERG